MNQIDLGFTNFVNAPGTPSTPGASDFNRLQTGINFLARKPICRMASPTSGLGNLASGTTWAVMGLANTVVDTDNMASNSSIGGITINTSGIYRVDVATWINSSSSTGSREVKATLYRAGNGPVDDICQGYQDQGSGLFGSIIVGTSCIGNFGVGDNIKAYQRQSSGVTADLPATSAGPYLQVEWIGYA